ncbi:MAG: bifunctional folylpolyglutamate synthase/dihydrofolate synthase [Ruminococcaceae bacterium]|nr:bifunctional folylpolyglutamate synthase/dihydrofolate synthase [Oscillospiraceae bacterium]
MDIKEAIDYIHSLSKFGKKSGLDNIRLLLEKMGNPQDELKFVHIAGTNGKGSIARFISQGLIEAGLKVGLYTSPYIEVFNERIQINNENIPDADLIEMVTLVKEKVEEINAKDYYPIEFEVITAIGMEYFKRQKCDIVILETGLGGRLDCTNIIKAPIVSVIGAIGFDHTQYLGDKISDIAFEKCGIIKYGSYVVVYQNMNPAARKVVKHMCMANNVLSSEDGRLTINKMDKNGTSFTFNDIDYEISMMGEHQVYNAICAINTLRHLKMKFEISDDNIKAGLKKAFWKCRMEVLGKNKDVIIDGAHNNHAIVEFCKTLKNNYADKEKIIILGMLEEKDYRASIKEVAKIADRLLITKVNSPRQNDVKKIYKTALEYKENAILYEDNEEALEFASYMKKDDSCVFVVGSLYLAGNVRGIVDKYF